MDDVFAAVPEQELRAVGRRRTFARDEVVFHRDDPGDSLHRVERGRFAARIMTPVGDTATVSLHGQGDVFGLLAVIGAAPRRTATVVALESAETLAIPASAFNRLRATHPQIRDAVDRLLVSQLAETSNRLVEALYLPASARVRVRLADLARIVRRPRRRRRRHPAQPGAPGRAGRHQPRDREPRAQARAGAGYPRAEQEPDRGHAAVLAPAPRNDLDDVPTDVT